MLERITARNGSPTIKYDGKFLHSKYDPQKEARRFLSSYDFSSTSHCILIEPGLDYCASIIKEEYPDIRVFSLHCIDEICSLVFPVAESHFPASSESLYGFLSTRIRDPFLNSTQIIEWEASSSLFREAFENLRTQVHDFFRIRNASLQTIGILGRLWLSNTIRNFLDIGTIVPPPKVTQPLVIAAPGPNLEKIIPILRHYRNAYTLWALSSSLATLLAEGLTPDLIFHTDSSYYARFHLRPLLFNRFPPGHKPSIAATLTAAVDREVAYNFTRLLIRTENASDSLLLGESDMPYLSLPSHGTVAGTTYYAAVKCAENDVFFAGLDLAFKDVKSHAAGHSFSFLHLSHSDRFQPLHTIYYTRSPYGQNDDSNKRVLKNGERWLSDQALETYARWFSTQHRGHFYRIAPSPVPLHSFYNLDKIEFEEELYLRYKNRGAFEEGVPHSKKRRIHGSKGYLSSRDEKRSLLNRYLKLLRERVDRLCNSAIEDAQKLLLADKLLYETGEQCNLSALLRMWKGNENETEKRCIALDELCISLYRHIEIMETLIKAYGEE